MTGKREKNRSRQARRILAAARSEFARMGFDGVSVGDVAAKAGVARATVFNYFGSKRALVEAITEEVMAYYQTLLERALAHPSAPVPDLIRALFVEMGSVIEKDPRFYRSVFRQIVRVQLGYEEAGRENGSYAAVHALRRRLLVAGLERGELSAAHEVENLAGAFDSLVNGTIVRWLYEEPDEPLRERMRCAAEVFLTPVSTEGSRPRRRSLPKLGRAPQGGRRPARSPR